MKVRRYVLDHIYVRVILSQEKISNGVIANLFVKLYSFEPRFKYDILKFRIIFTVKYNIFSELHHILTYSMTSKLLENTNTADHDLSWAIYEES
ncbi:hypothetical protein AYI68_g2617 [Smittium mucronatum]|uniref:Uncharacterized protein n=1 Tax=Smittium mucronatum TaxID=133383 RepID=A0A1R0H2B2_9FUNG|nr:hypothetical protein AYI68_g2617 [Smittium mucronatum]